MSITESATGQNPAKDFAASPEESDIQAGNPLPIGGAQEQGWGVNFVLFSRHATAVRLELYQYPEDFSPTRIHAVSASGSASSTIRGLSFDLTSTPTLLTRRAIFRSFSITESSANGRS
jgi:pullulanase/glycogen debranching enzyme